MRAARFHQFGEPQVLTVEDAPEPHAGPGEIRIRVAAASVNPIDWKLRAGHLEAVYPVPLPAIPGRDASGTVDEVGEGVTDVQVGDTVWGLGGLAATTAELAVLTAWAPVPSTWSLEQAAAAGLATATAAGALDALGDLQGRTLLIEGAGGGVGSAGVELAVARGATVIGTASERNHEFLRSLGAVPTTYGPGLADRVAALAPQGVDAAFDTAGSGSLADLVAIVGDAAQVVTVADYTAASLGARLVSAENDSTRLRAAAELGKNGAYTPRVERTFPLAEVADAHVYVQGGHTQGKVVVTL
ncbi:NADP-dependent oxidoreductase [Cellulomonas soli]|uniref:Oxidoreductase n=1 Tax=Cellulomonas soli TaxID=931535 RepID=A0A512PAR6_9CELL|nr:NADP-dependent oxidoreductase [Cellulomonas soli]NYI57416.1 NADPH:quinone reductase-like Zn-dependent oxidoreductase [Cellulomonas soli]GEP68303.1 oxidoreductase [Cellulomonas soli]